MLIEDELSQKIIEFISKYKDKYDQIIDDGELFEELKEKGIYLSTYILQKYSYFYYSQYVERELFNQIYSAIGGVPKEKNIYYKLTKIIEEEYGLDRDIIDVGAGYFPALAMEISKRQTALKSKGTITAYDPNLVVDLLDGVRLVKTEFPTNIKLNENSLIVSHKPCKTTEDIIKVANKNKIEFCITLCSCHEHIPTEYALEHPKITGYSLWKEFINDLINDTLPDGFTVEKGVFIHPFTQVNNSYDLVKTKKMGG